MNILILSGRLTADPEIKYTAQKKPYCKFTLAVPDSKERTDFIQCTAWEDTAERIAKTVRKGEKIMVNGKWTSGSYDKGGIRMYTNECTIRTFEYCEPRRSDAAEPKDAKPPKQESFTAVDDGLPF